jgi:hypothetical protein
VKFERADPFKRDYKRLGSAEREQFKKAVRAFHDGAERAVDHESPAWPKSMRVKRVQGTNGIWEMTWSMNDPDGRATWEWVEIDGEPGVRWRRIGDHSIFGSP